MEIEAMPGLLQAELSKMRRNVQQFYAKPGIACRFCGSEGKSAYQLLNQQSDSVVGSWCPTHGWLHFDSVGYPPTERLTANEVEDRRLQQRRKADFAIRKQSN